MLNKRIVYTDDNGNCCIIIPAACGLTIEQIAAKDVPAGKSYRIVDVNQLPKDRYFRDAWTDAFPTDTVDVHLDKAKEIKKDIFRELRRPLLEKLDIEFTRALESGSDTTVIKEKKQALRDVTNLLLPDDVDDLKNYIPDVLKQ